MTWARHHVNQIVDAAISRISDNSTELTQEQLVIVIKQSIYESVDKAFEEFQQDLVRAVRQGL